MGTIVTGTKKIVYLVHRGGGRAWKLFTRLLLDI